jgi:hypothetical protein
MNKTLLLILALSLVLWHAPSEADDSLASKFGRNRVKIQRAEGPKTVADAKLQAARSRYNARMEHCRGQTDRNKQYCMQEADQELKMSERRLRDAARKTAKTE